MRTQWDRAGVAVVVVGCDLIDLEVVFVVVEFGVELRVHDLRSSILVA
jgi:hypothetical protein